MTAQPGHNSVAKDHLRAFVERVERLEEHPLFIALVRGSMRGPR